VQAFQAIGVYSDQTTRNLTGQATWQSTNPLAADVSTAGGTRGQVTALAEGNADITATVMGLTAHAAVTVSPISQIQVTPPNPATPVGLRTQMTAIALLANQAAVDLTAQVTWTSDDDGVVAISNAAASRGMATALSPGSVAIRATFRGSVGETSYTVGRQTLQAIEVTPNDPMLTLAKGATLALRATGRYDDGSAFDLTGYATWLSSDPGVVFVSNAGATRGLATAVTSGVAKIVATWSGVPGATVITVP
jgi:hypothetical protein